MSDKCSCENCIDRMFTLGPAPCPQCGRTLRKAKFRIQTFEDTMVEREVDVRRRITKLYVPPIRCVVLIVGLINVERTLNHYEHIMITSKKSKTSVSPN